MINQTMTSLFGGLQVFNLEKVVFLRERGSKTYRVSSYYLAKSLAEIPHQLVFPTLFLLIAYWIIGFYDTPGCFFTFLLILILMALTAQALGLVISAGVPSTDVAMAIAPLLTTVLMLFGGFYINVSNIPVYFIWIYYISIFKYAFEALIINEFSNRTFMCAANEYIQVGTIQVCPVTTGAQVINNLSMENGSLWLDILVIFGMFLALRIFGYLVLRFRQKPRV